jgi:hypothetical protein
VKKEDDETPRAVLGRGGAPLSGLTRRSRGQEEAMARKIRRSDLPTVRSVQGDGTTRRQGLEALLEERRGALEPRRATCTASADPTDAAQELEKRV